MKPLLLAVRLPPYMLAELSRNVAVREAFEVLAVGQIPQHEAHSCGATISYLRDYPHDALEARTTALYSSIVDASWVTHAIVAQPLHWYSVAVENVLRARGVRVFWLESYFGRALLDEIGCPYTHDNEILRYGHLGDADRRIPRRLVTKFPHTQPASSTSEDLVTKYGSDAVIVFGQVPTDMALRDTSGGLAYDDWLTALITRNPTVRFLFKHHPLARTESAALASSNVVEVAESVEALCSTYAFGASYSSTVIREGFDFKMHAFVTGGHHLMSGLTNRVVAPEGLDDVLARLASQAAWVSSPKGAFDVKQRLSFLEHQYTLHLDSPAVLERLLVPRNSLELYYLNLLA